MHLHICNPSIFSTGKMFNIFTINFFFIEILGWVRFFSCKKCSYFCIIRLQQFVTQSTCLQSVSILYSNFHKNILGLLLNTLVEVVQHILKGSTQDSNFQSLNKYICRKLRSQSMSLLCSKGYECFLSCHFLSLVLHHARLSFVSRVRVLRVIF